jgi:hypothetical protein
VDDGGQLVFVDWVALQDLPDFQRQRLLLGVVLVEVDVGEVQFEVGEEDADVLTSSFEVMVDENDSVIALLESVILHNANILNDISK